MIAWVGADTRGPASLNLATDSRITWSAGAGRQHKWDQAKKVFASATAPLVVGFVGDVLFPTLVLPGIMDRIDRGVFRTDGSITKGVLAALRHGWSDYPIAEQRELTIYVAQRLGEGTSAVFDLTVASYQTRAPSGWSIESQPIPSSSQCIAVDGSGRMAVKAALDVWQKTSAAETSRAIFSGFVDAVISNVDQKSGGAPQLGCLYRIGPGRLLGIVHRNQRYFAGAHLIGDEEVQGTEWRNALFERADGSTKARLPGAQPQPRPPNAV